MKFTNDTWFHTLVIVLITFVSAFIGEFILENVFGIEDKNLLKLLTPLFVGFPVSLYFIKRVKRK